MTKTATERALKVIHVMATGPHWTFFYSAKQGDVSRLVVHGLEYSAEIRNAPPRIRLLEDYGRPGSYVPCELLDEWPDAPEYWPCAPPNYIEGIRAELGGAFSSTTSGVAGNAPSPAAAPKVKDAPKAKAKRGAA